VAHMGTSWEVVRTAARRAVARMDTSREVAHMAASRVIRSRHQRAVAGRKQRPEPHNLAHKMKREWRPSRQEP
jgi:hypothetical protein